MSAFSAGVANEQTRYSFTGYRRSADDSDMGSSSQIPSVIVGGVPWLKQFQTTDAP